MLRFLSLRTLLYWLIVPAGVAFLRGDKLVNRGILEHDEGHALLNANTWHHIMHWILSGGPFNDNSQALTLLRNDLHREGGTLYTAGKFGYSLLLATLTLPGQVTQAAGLALAWIAGLSVCALAGLLTWQYTRNLAAAWVAAIGCSLSPLMVYLSREVSGTIWALLFALAAAFALNAGLQSIRHRWKWCLSGGLLLGLAFTCHYNIAPFILAVFTATAIRAWQQAEVRKLREVIRALLPGALVSLSVLMIFEILTRIIDYRLREVFPDYRSFFGELNHLFFHAEKEKFSGVLHGDGVIGWGWDAWAYYAKVLLKEPLFFVLIFMPLIARNRHRSNLTKALPSLALTLIPLIFWALYVHRVQRVLGMVVVAGWISIAVSYSHEIARAAHWFLSGNPKKMVGRFVALIPIFFCVWLTFNTWKGEKSPLPQAVQTALSYVEKAGGRINAGSFHPAMGPLWKWTIVEEARQDRYAPARTFIDFSTFEKPDIIFQDPQTGNPTASRDFITTMDQLQNAREVYRFQSVSPNWTVIVRDLRYKSHGIPLQSTTGL